MSLKEEYQKLLIKQFYTKPKARAEISALFNLYADCFDTVDAFREAFNLETAQGDPLDIIGSWVGISRFQPSGERKGFFGFKKHTKALPFGQKSGKKQGGFRSKFAQDFLPLKLPDKQYRSLIKLKIIKNTAIATATQTGDVSLSSLQQAVNFAMEGEGYLIDHQNMSLTIVITPRADREWLEFILRLDLLPRPQGVQINYVTQEPKGTFGFNGHQNAISWYSRFDINPEAIIGYFAKKTFLNNRR